MGAVRVSALAPASAVRHGARRSGRDARPDGGGSADPCCDRSDSYLRPGL